MLLNGVEKYIKILKHILQILFYIIQAANYLCYSAIPVDLNIKKLTVGEYITFYCSLLAIVCGVNSEVL